MRLGLRSKLLLTAMPARSMVNCDFPSKAVPTEAPNDSVVLAKENVLFLVQLFLCGAVARYGFTV